MRREGVLMYLGMHRGYSFGSVFEAYERCYGFEANPAVFRELHEAYGSHPRVRLSNVAVADFNGSVEFNISNNDGIASSIGHLNDQWDNRRTGHVSMERTIRVPCINLYDFIREQGVDFIDDYVSDLQGMDLTVLRTLGPLIESRKIGSITCEVAKDGKPSIYPDLPDNSESGFRSLLGRDYELVARGWGILEDHSFRDVPETWWEMDCKWRSRS